MSGSVSPELLSALCHELRGPLGALGNWAHVLSAPDADASVRARAITGLVEDVRALGAVIDQVSALASVLSSPKAALVPIDVDSCLLGLLEAAEAESGRRAALRILEPSLRVLADPERLREMFRLFLGPALPAAEFAVTSDGAIVVVALTLALPPPPLPLAVARALAERQDGDVLTALEGNRTLVRFRLRRAP